MVYDMFLCFLLFFLSIAASSYAQNNVNSHSAPATAGCVLPKYPDYGSYTVTNVENAYPGQQLDFFQLTVTCRRGYGVVGDYGDESSTKNRQVYCLDGIWSQPMPKCVRFCKLNPDPSVQYKCHDHAAGFTECKNYVAPGTIVNPVCNSPYYYTFENLPNMKCISGYWDYVAQCKAECGRVTPESELLVLGGSRAKHGELPWHAGIYLKTTEPYKQICGGTLVTNNVIVSAAHCFWSDAEKHLPTENYAVAVGKLYRPWNNERDADAQKSDVKEIRIPTLFKGEATNYQEDIAMVIMVTSVTYKTYVRPVCLSFNSNFDKWQLQQGKLGKVAGWGLTSSSGNAAPVLQVVDLPYITENVCIESVPSSFREYVTADKFCAGYTNGTALCKGDSGGGLVFGDKEQGITRYYLRGVVSAAPKSEDEKACNDHSYTAFTKILKHEEFIKDSLAASVNKTCSPYLFQCDDGTCVNQGADCNGIQECPDGSDEAPELCNVGSRIMNRRLNPVCVLPPYPDHGTYEVTDESNARPGNSLESFALTVKCNQGYGVVDSHNHTARHGDQWAFCSKGEWIQNMPICLPICKLAQEPSIRYMCEDIDIKRTTVCDTTIAPGTTVYPICNTPNYFPEDGFQNMTCIDGKWDHIAKCKSVYCELPLDPVISYMCHDTETNETKVCDNIVAPGTTIYPRCNSPYFYEPEGFKNMTCISGSWDYIAKCNSDCGRSLPPSKSQQEDEGTRTNQEFMPWHVTIYLKQLGRFYAYQAIGSLVRNNIVLSTAFEFWDNDNLKTKDDKFGAAAGEFYRLWAYKKNIESQHSDVKEIKISETYKGTSNYRLEDVAVLILATPFVYTMYIRPVCLNFDANIDEQQLVDGNVGKLFVWGRLTRNETLSRRIVDMPLLDHDTCAHTLPNWASIVNGDKICGTLNNETVLDTLSVSSGAGYVFPYNENGIQRYHLRGIEMNYCLSKLGKDCNGFNYIISTRLIEHREFIEQHL